MKTLFATLALTLFALSTPARAEAPAKDKPAEAKEGDKAPKKKEGKKEGAEAKKEEKKGW